MKKHFNKELVMIKEDNEDLKNSTKCWIYDNDYINTDVKVRDDCYISGKYRRSAHINLKSQNSYHISQPKNYDSHLIMQELGKLNFEISVIPNGLEKYMICTINNKLSFMHSFQFVSSSLHNLVKNLNKDDFKYLSQEFYNNIWDLDKQKRFYPYEYMSDFEKVKEELPSKEKFYSSLTNRKITDKEYEHILKAWKTFEMKTITDYHNLYIKYNEIIAERITSRSLFECTRFMLGCNA